MHKIDRIERIIRAITQDNDSRLIITVRQPRKDGGVSTSAHLEGMSIIANSTIVGEIRARQSTPHRGGGWVPITWDERVDALYEAACLRHAQWVEALKKAVEP